MIEKPILGRGPTLSSGDGPPIPSHTRHPLRIAAILVAAVIVSLLVAWLVLFVTKGRFLKRTFEHTASRSLDRKVIVGGDFQLYFDPITIHFVAERLQIGNPQWAGAVNFFSADRIDTRIATLPLIVGTHRINWLDLAGGRIDLQWDASGRRNTWTFGNGEGKPLDLPTIRRAALTGTRIHYGDPRMQLVADMRFEPIRAVGTRVSDDIGFDGTGLLRGRPFTLSGQLLSPNETIGGGRNRFALHAAAASDRLEVVGTLAAPTRVEGADLAVRATGANLARLFDFIGVAVPDTRSYRLAAHLTKLGDEWRFTRLNGRFGKSDLAGHFTIAKPADRIKINADLNSRSVDIVDLGPFIGYDPNGLATGAVARQVGSVPRILPDAPLRIDALAAFDAHLVYAVKDIRAPSLPISDVALVLDLDRGLLKLSPLTFDMSRGHLSSDIIIDARRQPIVTDYDIRLAPTPLGRLLAGWGVDESGTTGTLKARVQLKGQGGSVHDSLSTANGRIAIILPKGTMWTRNVQLSELDIGTFITKMFAKKLERPVAINCGLIAFTVRDGHAVADPVLIDTTKNVVTARGGFSFADESLDLAVNADAKTFSFFSGQSPVGIKGHFARPGLDIISPELLARAGVGIGLAVVATPLAAIIAFIDPGDAKAADCGPVLAGASAAAQRTAKGGPRKDVR